MTIFNFLIFNFGLKPQFRTRFGPFWPIGPNSDLGPNFGPLWQHCISIIHQVTVLSKIEFRFEQFNKDDVIPALNSTSGQFYSRVLNIANVHNAGL